MSAFQSNGRQNYFEIKWYPPERFLARKHPPSMCNNGQSLQVWLKRCQDSLDANTDIHAVLVYIRQTQSVTFKPQLSLTYSRRHKTDSDYMKILSPVNRAAISA